MGHRTLFSGKGKLVPGRGPVRTGVTMIVPHQGNVWKDRPSAAWSTINGCGELTGALELDEFGSLETPIGLTNTTCIHNVVNGPISHVLEKNAQAGITESTVVPVVSECDDSFLNDSRGMHVQPEHACGAIAAADFREPPFRHSLRSGNDCRLCFDLRVSLLFGGKESTAQCHCSCGCLKHSPNRELSFCVETQAGNAVAGAENTLPGIRYCIIPHPPCSLFLRH